MKLLTVSILIAALFGISCRPRVGHAPMPCCSKAQSEANAEPSANRPTLPAAAAHESPDMSVYQLTGEWTDQDNQRLSLHSLKGHIQLVAMIYTSCGYTCPRLVEDMKRVRGSLPDNVRDQVGCVLITMDPDRDSPARLRQFAATKELDRHWELLRGTPDQVRELSMVLNVRYKDLGNGNFSHSATILILDKDGRIIRSLDGLDAGLTGASDLISKIASR